MTEQEREEERLRLLRRITYMRWGPGRRPNHADDGRPDPRIEKLRARLRALDES